MHRRLLGPAPANILEAHRTIESTPRDTGYVGKPQATGTLDNQSFFNRTDALPERENLRGHQRIWVTARGLPAVLARLRLDLKDVQAVKGRVLSIGEGASDFVRRLSVDHGVKAFALDWWYAMNARELEERFVITEPQGAVLREVGANEALARLAPLRVAAQATALPIKDESCARVYLSNVVYWYFAPTRRKSLGLTDDAEGHEVIRQAARCVEVGGELRFDMTNAGEASALAEILRGRFMDFSIATDDLVVIMTRQERIPPAPAQAAGKKKRKMRKLL